MTETPTKLPVKQEEKALRPRAQSWMPFEGLRAEIDRLFDDFTPSFWRRSFDPVHIHGSTVLPTWALAPAIDLVEKEASYEITAELPGIEEKDIEVKVANGNLTIRGEKLEAKEEKDREYVLSERRYGSFQRTFKMPQGVKAEDIAATFSKGVLTVTLPKTKEAQQSDRKIQVKAA
ncbi:Hsp20/alpha crystallin family protein (plasmid) [Ensifer sp. PDNC004]|uniref:Hsp20/alpha crystallin family protein n=1 Tax=unclassified Ensifer TaxID=2633371 RepID=UPI001784A2F5|nr:MULTISPECIES: Hsp20/alpha crystallin family protein [unclassified Ensifer]MBD9649896.1 Hsp20/alpha crystallin family protein [Ensifer sp. ENS09]QRY70506.1 Hsp20/alpha crystallin family protein [Ensifer sp. PDNC004]